MDIPWNWCLPSCLGHAPDSLHPYIHCTLIFIAPLYSLHPYIYCPLYSLHPYSHCTPIPDKHLWTMHGWETDINSWPPCKANKLFVYSNDMFVTYLLHSFFRAPVSVCLEADGPDMKFSWLGMWVNVVGWPSIWIDGVSWGGKQAAAPALSRQIAGGAAGEARPSIRATWQCLHPFS